MHSSSGKLESTDSGIVSLCAVGWPLEFGCGSWPTSRKSTHPFKVLDIPHGWRPLRVIASMTTQHWNASASSGRDRSAKAREGCLGSRYKNGYKAWDAANDRLLMDKSHH